MSSQAEAPSTNLPVSWTMASDFVALAKPRIVLFVALSALVGFVLGTSGAMRLEVLIPTLIGTAMVAAGTAALNQFAERDPDARMRRTAGRPLPSGRLGAQEAHCFGVLISISGISYLTLCVNLPTGLTAAATLAIYLFLYTPLKRRTPFNTAVGAVAGALPPVGGWAAATGGFGAGGWALFGILFLWQFPHVLAITWLHREDYARGGFRMLAVTDPEGRRTALRGVVYTLILIPVSLLPAFMGMTGRPCASVILLLGLGFLWFGVRFYRERTPHCARVLILVSLVYLPAVWMVMLLGRMLG